MTRQTARRLVGVIVILLGSLGSLGSLPAHACCGRSFNHVDAQTFLKPVPTSGRDAPQAAAGEGAYTYRFVVRDANRPERPWRRARYQVSTREGVKWPGGPDAHQGVTDAQGRTAVYRSTSPVDPGDWMVLPLLGRGTQGLTYRLVDQDDHGVADHAYLIDVEGGGIFCGRSLPGGHTARVLSGRPTNMRLDSSVDEEACRQLASALNPVMAEAHPQRRIKGLKRLLEQGWSRPSLLRIQGKLSGELEAHGSEGEIRALVSRWLSEPGVSREALADRFNSLGYGLVTQKPPRMTTLAESLLAQGLAISPSPAILDSHAWSLHALGRHEEALVELEVAIEGFHQSCEPEQEPMYRETLAHRVEVLAALGREAEVRPEPRACADIRDQRFLSEALDMPAAQR